MVGCPSHKTPTPISLWLAYVVDQTKKIYHNIDEGCAFPMAPIYDHLTRTIPLPEAPEMAGSSAGRVIENQGFKATEGSLDFLFDQCDADDIIGLDGDRPKKDRTYRETSYADFWDRGEDAGTWTYNRFSHRKGLFTPGGTKGAPNTETLDLYRTTHVNYADGKSEIIRTMPWNGKDSKKRLEKAWAGYSIFYDVGKAPKLPPAPLPSIADSPSSLLGKWWLGKEVTRAENRKHCLINSLSKGRSDLMAPPVSLTL